MECPNCGEIMSWLVLGGEHESCPRPGTEGVATEPEANRPPRRIKACRHCGHRVAPEQPGTE